MDGNLRRWNYWWLDFSFPRRSTKHKFWTFHSVRSPDVSLLLQSSV